MEKTRIEALENHVSPERWAEVTTLYNAYISNLRAMQTDHSAARVRDYNASADALDQLVAELEARYFGKPECFANVKEAIAFLQAQGYKVAKSKVYKDAKKGLLKVQEDKSVLEADVLAYAVRAGLEKKPEKASKVDDSVFADRANAELQLLEVRKRKLQFEHERELGLYIPKVDVQAELAMKLGAMEAGFKHLVAVNLNDWIESVSGDVGAADDLREAIYEQVDGLMNEFCSFDELQIVIRPAGCGAVEE